MDSTPLCYTQLLGHEKAKKLLSRAQSMQRLPHGFLFRGPQGVGKSLFARGLAAAINCKDVNRVGACGICSSCKKFRSQNHPDFMVLEPEKGVIKIDRIRELTKEIGFPPYESEYRVVVLKDVQLMRREAGNALLKTLEEPPHGNILVLTADSSKEVLPTLISRCQVLPFTSLSQPQTVTLLKQQGVSEEEANLLAGLSEGSPGRALLLMQTEMVDIWKAAVTFISDKKVDLDRDVTLLLRLAEKMAALKDDLVVLLGLLRLWIRDLLLDKKEGVAQAVVGSSSQGWTSEELFVRMEAIDRAEQELSRNCNRNLVCEVLLFKLQ